jgi:hypothetical protein
MAKPAALPATILLVTALLAAPATEVKAAPPLPPPLPELPSTPGTSPEAPVVAPSNALATEGTRLVILGLAQRGAWRWIGRLDAPPRELWLPLEVAQGQLGVTSRSRGAGGALELEWFGAHLVVAADRQRPLGDEVAIDLAPLLAANGLTARASGSTLLLEMPTPQLLGIRPSTSPPGLRRVVLDLSGPAIVRSNEPGGVVVAVSSSAEQRAGLASQGLRGSAAGALLRITDRAGATPTRIFSLGEPHRLVLDLPGDRATAPDTASPGRIDPRLQARLGRQILWDRLVREVAGRRVRINAVRIDLVGSDLELRPLSRGDGMEGLSSLMRLANRQDALVAINGGFFNRVRRLPLGALRDQGRWLSGPILNRGAVGWDPGGLPRFGRLRLEEAVLDAGGNRWAVSMVNSGYVQRGLSRYTAGWGPTYRSLVDGETAVLVRDGVVRARYGADLLAAGIPLGAGDTLLVGRAGFSLPWPEGETLHLESRPSTAVGLAANVVGGGPLLLLGGRPVLDGAAEGFSAAFLSQGAPRTVIGSDGRQLWLITLEGVDDEGPTLLEATQLMAGLGLRDALNLDGGSSTGLVMGGLHTVKGRGVVSAVHNGLGLVPRSAPASLNRAGS